MSDNTQVLIREQKDGSFELWRQDVDAAQDYRYKGRLVGKAETVKAATEMADWEFAEYGYAIVWLTSESPGNKEWEKA